MTDRDRLLERVIAELKQPVGMDPAARRRLLDAARADSPPGPAGALAAWLRRRPLRLALASAAGAAVVALAVIIAPRGPAGGPERAGAAGQTTPVRFVLAAPARHGVTLVGDFNNWDRDATPLERSGTGDEWSVTVPLAPGRHAYAFVVDGTRWVPDPSAPRAPDDGFGIPSSVILIPERM